MKNEVLIGINQGINYRTISTRIADKFNTAYKNAERLVRTEVNYIHNQATTDGYKDAGVEKYQFLATLDSRTSQTCAGLNGEVFEVKNIAVGINYPPMHPRCRSTTIPIIDYSVLDKIKEDEKNESKKDNIDEISLKNDNKSSNINVDPTPTTMSMMWLQNESVEYNKVFKMQTKISIDEIITKIDGGDLTKGSCSSLAFAYIGNRNGLDVLDFRDGKSREIFANKKTILEIANLNGIKSKIVRSNNDYKAVKELLKEVVKDKEYYLGTDRHAAIIRKIEDKFEYLELQSPTENGFKELNNKVLESRFGCKKSHTSYGMKLESSNMLMDLESFADNEDFEKLLGYINTLKDKQIKGDQGNVK